MTITTTTCELTVYIITYEVTTPHAKGVRSKAVAAVAAAVMVFGLMVMMVLGLVMVVSVVLRVMRVVLVVHVRVEPVLLVGRVRHLPDASVRLHHAVASVHHITVAFFPLVFVVLGVRVLDAVLVRVLRWCLMTAQKKQNFT